MELKGKQFMNDLQPCGRCCLPSTAPAGICDGGRNRKTPEVRAAGVFAFTGVRMARLHPAEGPLPLSSDRHAIARRDKGPQVPLRWGDWHADRSGSAALYDKCAV
jgi:hypothetical protein